MATTTSVAVVELAATQTARQASRRTSSKSLGGRDPSLRWPHLYDILRSKGYSKEKAARISNSRLRYRKKGKLYGLPWQLADSKGALRAVARGQRSRTASSLIAACYSKSCAPPPVGKGGSNPGGAGGDAGGGTGGGGGGSGNFPIIKASEARGDSRGVSAEEFQELAQEGQKRLDGMKARSSSIDGMDEKWDQVKADSYAEATQSWGGATIDSHTGEALPQGANKYALTVKDKGFDTVSVPENATRAEFDAAMDQAKEKFRSILEREDHHLGVFHDDDLGRIDIDPVVVTSNLNDVHTIGAATRAIGGAYNFSDGNGYWPPHVKEKG